MVNTRSQWAPTTMDEPGFDTDFMIQSAAGLQSVAMKIHREGKSALDQHDYPGFIGSFQAAPILQALGIEIALKAWICRESKGSYPNDHDLLCLFERLDRKTQDLLEEAWQQGRGAGTVDDPIHELPAPMRLIRRPSSLREVLDEHRRVFVSWRYLHEIPDERPGSGILDRVLTVLIGAY